MYVDGEVIEKMIVTILEGFERIERKLDRMNRLKDCFDGDELLDNVDLCKLLNVTDRTLARYRSKKLIKYWRVTVPRNSSSITSSTDGYITAVPKSASS